jgi:DnaJ like chaperone protein
MQIWGKIVGGTAGFAIGGPIAALLGVMAGHAVDHYVLEGRVSSETAPAAPRDPHSSPGDHPGLREVAFTIGVIALGAKMARVDGEVSRAEVEAFRSFFQVPPGEEKNVERFFDLAKRDAAGFETYARQVAALFPDAPEILESILEGLFSIAEADGRSGAAEADYLAQVARIFGLDSNRFERAKAAALGVVECEACVILGIDPLATDEQIREAWLRLVRANHPDRLIAQGLPEEAIAVASRKLALINDAYDRLKRERGLAAA